MLPAAIILAALSLLGWAIARDARRYCENMAGPE